MNATTAAPPTLLTGEEFVARHAHQYAELVDGVVVWENHVPSFRHGKACSTLSRVLGNFVEAQDLGHVVSNDTFIRLRKSPDLVRGPDVAFFSYSRVPQGPGPEGITDVMPELAVEVMSPSNDWSDIFTKVGEYLRAGVLAVLVLDPETATVSVYRKDELQQIFDNGDDLVIADVLPGFTVPVKKLFGL